MSDLTVIAIAAKPMLAAAALSVPQLQSQTQPLANITEMALNAGASVTAPSASTTAAGCGDSASKYRCTITSERLAQLKRQVEAAVRDRRTFTIKGGWQTLRSALLRRQWLEKYETSKKPAAQSMDELCQNLPSRQVWETPSAHTEKCERIIMSRLLQLHEVDFYWNIRKDQSDWHHRVAHNKIISRFARSLFTSKEGLCLLLQQMYWFLEPGVAEVNFPRCYVLGFPDHFNNFVDDFRITACVSLLKWYTTGDIDTLAPSADGKVPMSAVDFAIQRCHDFVAVQRHSDVDSIMQRVWDHEWDQFITHYNCLVHEHQQLLNCKEMQSQKLFESAQKTLREILPYLPQSHMDGYRNIWIMKPGNKCRGRGIQLVKTIEDVARIVNLKLKFVVQKYIEQPLVIYDTKFDIRQWFLVTSVQPLVVWMYRDSYLRFSTQIFSLENFHESLHLTNHAVQCKYKNVGERDKALPDENMWDCHTFKTYLKRIGCMEKWDDVVHPGMKAAIVGAMLACQDTMDRRPNTFELYGADFMLDEQFQPWLLEINSCPDLSSSTSVTARMCPACLEDLVKVVVDMRKDPKADTGLFDCIYKQNFPRAPAYLGMSLSVRGRRIFKGRTKYLRNVDEQVVAASDPVLSAYPKMDDAADRLDMLAKAANTINYYKFKLTEDFRQPILLTDNLPALVPERPAALPRAPPLPRNYKGPEIGDLMEELHRSYFNHTENGVDFVPAIKVQKKKPGNKERKLKKRKK